jgi:hypothetical protein
MQQCRVEKPTVLWGEIVQIGISQWGKNTLKGILCCLVLGAAVYNLWRTRNELKHSGQPSTEKQLLKKIIWEVRSKLAGKGKFPKTRENLILVSLWNLPADLLL